MRLAFVVPPLSGHLNPALSVGGELQDRGHEIHAFGLADSQERIEAAGIRFHPICTDTLPLGTVPRTMRRQGELTGIQAMRWILQCLQNENLGQMRDLPEAFSTHRIQGLIADQLAYGAASVAQRDSLPYVTLCNALPVHLDRSVPPFAMSWKPLPPRAESIRTWLSFLPLRPLFHQHWKPIHRLRDAWGLPRIPPGGLPDSPLAILSQQPREFEFPQRRLPPHFHLTGPWQRPDTRPAEPFPFEQLDGRPVIYASLGTLQNRIDRIFRIIAEACAPLNVQLVLALGARDARIPKDLPGKPVVVRFAPQLKLLRIATLVITHAGLNTALEALANGVPTVAIPITNDQPGVAARLRACGAGEFVRLSRLTASRLRSRIQHVLTTPSYRQAAGRIAESIAREDGTSHAANIIESVFHSVLRLPHPDPSFPKAAAIAAVNRASDPGATQHQSPKFESFSAQWRSVGT